MVFLGYLAVFIAGAVAYHFLRLSALRRAKAIKDLSAADVYAAVKKLTSLTNVGPAK